MNNAKIERARGVPKRKRSHNKDNPRTIFSNFIRMRIKKA